LHAKDQGTVSCKNTSYGSMTVIAQVAIGKYDLYCNGYVSHGNICSTKNVLGCRCPLHLAYQSHLRPFPSSKPRAPVLPAFWVKLHKVDLLVMPERKAMSTLGCCCHGMTCENQHVLATPSFCIHPCCLQPVMLVLIFQEGISA
jgi:hypothetical protein